MNSQELPVAGPQDTAAFDLDALENPIAAVGCSGPLQIPIALPLVHLGLTCYLPYCNPFVSQVVDIQSHNQEKAAADPLAVLRHYCSFKGESLFIYLIPPCIMYV